MAKRIDTESPKPTHQEIAQRAYALFEQKGRIPGRDMENWLEAEAQLIAAHQANTKAQEVVNAPAKSLAIQAQLKGPANLLPEKAATAGASKPATRKF